MGLLAAGAVVVAATGTWLALRSGPSKAAAAPAVLHGDAVFTGAGRPAPAVSLRDQTGRMVSLRSLRGRVLVVTFLDSHCTDTCPIEGQELHAVDRLLPRSQRPTIVVVSVNPADTPSSVRRFVARAGWSGPWFWLMGSHRRLAPVWRAFRIEVVMVHSGAGSEPAIGHSTAIYLLNRSGREREGYMAPFLPASVAADVRTLEG